MKKFRYFNYFLILLLTSCSESPLTTNENPDNKKQPEIQSQVNASPVKEIKPNLDDELLINKMNVYQNYPVVATDKESNFAVSWIRFRLPDKIDVYTQKYDNQGIAVSKEIKVNDSDIYNSYIGLINKPGIAMDPEGNFVIVWQMNAAIYMRKYNAKSEPVTPETKVGQLVNNNNVDVAMAEDGSFVVAGTRQAQKFDMDAKPIGNILEAPGTLRNVLINKHGNILLMGDYEGQWYDKAGTKIGDSFRGDNHSSLAVDKEGNIFFVRHSYNNTTYDILIQRFAADNEPIGAVIKANDSVLDFDFTPTTDSAMDSSGNFIVVWGEDGIDRNKGQVFARKYNVDGEAKGSDFKVNTTANGFKSSPSVAINEIGDFIIVWQNWNDNKNEYSIYARKLNFYKSVPQVINSSTPDVIDCSRPKENPEVLISKPLPDFISLTEEQKKYNNEEFSNKEKNNPVYTRPIEIFLESDEKEIDISQAGALNGLNDENNSMFGIVTVNDTEESAFQPNNLIINLNKSGCETVITSLYDAKPVRNLNFSFILYSFNLSKAPINKIETLIREYNKVAPINIKKIKFSSLAALQTFAIYLDLIINYNYLFKSINFNSINILSSKEG